MSFIVFVVAAAVGTSGIGYGLSMLERRTGVSRRCRAPHEALRRRRTRGQRVRCRFKG